MRLLNPMQRRCLSLSLLLASMVCLFWGCGNDEGPGTPAPTGIIVIDATPDAINAPWSISGGAGFRESGVGDETLTGMANDRYDLTWGDVDGWISPTSPYQILTEGSAVVFEGVYELQTGTIVLDVTPDLIGAPWTLVGPGGETYSGTEDRTFVDMAYGEYTVTWGDVSGNGHWRTPPAATFQLDSDTLTNESHYVWIPAFTESELVSRFQGHLEGRDYEYGYALDLDPDFQLMIKPETQAAFGLPNPYFTYAEDLRIMENIFSGNKPSENVGGITEIQVVALNQVAAWQDSQDPEFSTARFAPYLVQFVFFQGPSRTMTVQGEIDFYLSSMTVIWDGSERSQFKLVGQRDRTSGSKANEDVSWGGVKALYR